MKIINLTNAAKLGNFPDLDARLALDLEDIQIVHLTLKPEEVIDAHELPIKVIFIVLEGKGEISINDEKEVVSENCLIEVPPGANRGWKAIGDKELRIAAIKLQKTFN